MYGSNEWKCISQGSYITDKDKKENYITVLILYYQLQRTITSSLAMLRVAVSKNYVFCFTSTLETLASSERRVQ